MSHLMRCPYLHQAPEFPEFTSEVLEAINSLGGGVFPKLNWSAPRVKRCTLLLWLLFLVCFLKV